MRHTQPFSKKFHMVYGLSTYKEAFLGKDKKLKDPIKKKQK
ncbi:MAG: hypothetical protein ACREAD_02725 [Nitrosopumilaceae archaeon]